MREGDDAGTEDNLGECRRVILLLLKLRPSLQQGPATKYELTIPEVEDWRERFLQGGEHALLGRLQE